jgi:hypothetical protein
MAWNVVDLPGARIEEFGTTLEYPLGTTCTARNTTSGYVGEFIYLQGIGSTVAGSWVSINPDNYTTALLADGHIGGAAVSMTACVADNYGWYQIYGKAEGYVDAGVADNAGLYTTATAGMAGATASGQSEIIGARAAEAADASSAGNIEVELSYPVLGLSAGA